VTHGKNLGAEVQRTVPRLRHRADRTPEAEFIRLGVLGDWANPYLTMDFAQRGR
jgi:isoleucyl-tRNA synthetase